MNDHDRVANSLAKELTTKHRNEGVDIVVGGKAIEVAVSDEDIRESVKQLNRSRAAFKYMAVPSQKVESTEELLKGTGMGVMNLDGKIKKRSTRKTR